MTRQFLLICDEAGMKTLESAFKSETIQFLEVQGMNLNGENKLNLLVTPVLSPVPPAVIMPPAQPPAAPAEAPMAE